MRIKLSRGILLQRLEFCVPGINIKFPDIFLQMPDLVSGQRDALQYTFLRPADGFGVVSNEPECTLARLGDSRSATEVR